MIVVLDANILLRLSDPSDPLHVVTKMAVTALHLQGATLRVVPQAIYEFWVVATRPRTSNGLGLSVPDCERELTRLYAAFPPLDEQSTLLSEWRFLVNTYSCHGKVAHDARIVAAMRTHGMTHLLTFNVGDFARFPGLTVLDPKAIGASPATTS